MDYCYSGKNMHLNNDFQAFYKKLPLKQQIYAKSMLSDDRSEVFTAIAVKNTN
jgi:hypothetical protein